MFHCATCDKNIPDHEVNGPCSECGHIECSWCGEEVVALPDDKGEDNA